MPTLCCGPRRAGTRSELPKPVRVGGRLARVGAGAGHESVAEALAGTVKGAAGDGDGGLGCGGSSRMHHRSPRGKNRLWHRLERRPTQRTDSAHLQTGVGEAAACITAVRGERIACGIAWSVARRSEPIQHTCRRCGHRGHGRFGIVARPMRRHPVVPGQRSGTQMQCLHSAAPQLRHQNQPHRTLRQPRARSFPRHCQRTWQRTECFRRTLQTSHRHNR